MGRMSMGHMSGMRGREPGVGQGDGERNTDVRNQR